MLMATAFSLLEGPKTAGSITIKAMCQRLNFRLRAVAVAVVTLQLNDSTLIVIYKINLVTRKMHTGHRHLFHTWATLINKRVTHV